MKLCISQATTMSTPFEADLDAYSRGGWEAVELWLTKLETYLESHSAADARALLESKGLTPAAAAVQGGLLLSRGTERETHWDHYKRRLQVLQELGVPTLVVAADFVREMAADDYGRGVASIVEAGALAGTFGVRIALEFQRSARFCASLDTTLALIAQSRADNVGVCLDLFHYYTGPSKFEDLAYLTPENLAWVHACDLSGVPRELATDSDRIFPGEGDFQAGPIFNQLRAVGYTGYLSLEVLNPGLWALPVDRVADFGYQALYRVVNESNRPSPTRESAAPGGPDSGGGF